MAYHMKSAAESFPADSEHPLLEPETHVALRQVSVTGQRYYMTEIGRWINRDPAGAYGGANFYQAFKNAAVIYIDLLGLKDVYGREIKRYTSLDEQPPQIRLHLSPKGVVSGGSSGYTVEAVPYEWEMKATAAYLDCECKVALIDGTLTKSGSVAAKPIILVPGGDPMLLPTPFTSFAQFLKSLLGGEGGKWGFGEVLGPIKFLHALANWDPDGSLILNNIKATAPQSLDDMEWDDLNFLPCPVPQEE